MNIARRLASGITLAALSFWALGGSVHAADSVYVVRPGDSIYGIALAQGISVGSLMSANDLEITSVILPGQRLALPGGSTDGTGPNGGTPTAASPYTVVSGDSLSGIASKHGVALSDLIRTNDLDLTSVILPGQRLSVPGGSAPTTAGSANGGAATATYRVVAGDSLSAIASKHGVTLADLLRANQLRIDSLILPGRVLKLPAGASVSEADTDSGAGHGAGVASTRTHTVVAGNSLSGIAAMYGVRLAELLSVSGLQVDSLILPGQQLRLPAGASLSTPSAPPASSLPAASPNRTRIDTVVSYALAQQGKRYAFFTKGPEAFDCSGLVLAAYRQVGIDLTHWSAAQAMQGVRVDLDNDRIRPGDLIFQQRHGSIVVNHVGMAVDEHRWIQAVGPGRGVKVGPLPDATTISVVRRYITD